ncbi:LCP family protein [Candidatus Saccharibacteria bacterium]|nr:LCP family protein [Candidatus Saccharibacteria bacterium]
MSKSRAKRASKVDPANPSRYSSYRTYTPRGTSGIDHASVEVETKRSKSRLFGLFLAFLLLISIAALLIIGLWDARNISAASQKMFGSGNIFSLINSSDPQVDSSGRVNILVAGYSADDPGHAGANLTDSIMLISLNPQTKTGYMLSIPRDLYVRIPGQGHGKINEVYRYGGMPMLSDVVQTVTGKQIGYYALVNYAAVRGIVDAVGGIDVTINSPDGRLYDPNKDWSTGGPLVDLANGTHHLSGQQALNLSRARGDPSQYGYPVGFEQSDFQRTADQRLILAAIKSKLNWKLVLNPWHNSDILNAAADNVQTNIPAEEARPVFGLFFLPPSFPDK